MSKKLIITEKPSVARDFARVLGVSGNRNGFIENDQYVISWCVGHLVGLVYPEAYDPKYASWNLEDLPFLPKEYKYGVLENTQKQYEIVTTLLHRDDIDTVYWAGDSGKEGQTIEENIRMFGGVRDGMEERRVWIDSQTDDEIKRGITEAKPMSDYANLGKSGIMRTIEDYALGINFSRALSVKYGNIINNAAATKSYTAIAVGRVMTCVLGMVVDREREIRNFQELPFYKVNGNFTDSNILAEWKVSAKSRYFNYPKLYKDNGFQQKEDAEQLIQYLQGKKAYVEDLESGTSKKKAPLLFNLAELQSECSKLFKISPSETLQVIQDLYEKKLTTYPRTDARVLTKAVSKEIYKNLYGLQKYDPLSNAVNEIIQKKSYVGLEKTSYVDDSKVTDHYAIIPTGQTAAIGGLDTLHTNVYELIVKRFLSIFYPPAEYFTIKLTAKVEEELFYASAKSLQNPGYLCLYGNKNASEKEGENEDTGNNKEALLALTKTLHKGDEIRVNGYEVKDGKTSPPKRYTSGTLILAMENAGKLIEEEELREQIKNTGIGTSATRGEILEKLVRIHYLNQSKQQIITPSNLGEMIYEVVKLTSPSLLNPKMTASWEKGLEGITEGTVDDVEYRQLLEDYIRKETCKMIEFDLTNQIAQNIHPFTGKDAKGIASRKPLGIPCPDCGGELTKTSFGYGCSNYFDEAVQCKFSVGNICGIEISEEDFRQLITDGRTPVINGFVNKAKRKFNAALVLKADEAHKHSISFEFAESEPEYIENLFCPVCHGRMQITGYGYACEHRSKEADACYFGLGEIAGHKLTLEELRTLLENGSTAIIKGFKSKDKSSFKAKLKLTENDGKKVVVFDFEGIGPDLVDGVVCPDCGGQITIRKNGYMCEHCNFDDPDACKFYIGKIAQKSLTVANVKELLQNQRTQTLRGFKGKSGKKFDACLLLQKRENGRSEVVFDFENVEAKTIKDVCCPLCKGEIVKTPFGFGCKNYDKNDPEHSCRFQVGTIAGLKISEKILKELLQNGVTEPINGFKSKSGNTFSAKLILKKEENGEVSGIGFAFEEEDTVLDNAVCPMCKKEPIIKTRFGYKCNDFSKEEGHCKFYLGKIAGFMLTEEQFRELLANSQTGKISGFTSKSGNLFEASLKFDEQYRVVFDFE